MVNQVPLDNLYQVFQNAWVSDYILVVTIDLHERAVYSIDEYRVDHS